MAKRGLSRINFKAPMAKEKAVIIILAVAVFFIGGMTLMFSYFTTSGFCVICHSMKPEYEAWKKSSHAKVPCMACHLPPGGSATLIWDHVKAGKLVVAQIMGYEKPINPESEVSKDIETERCERCHDLETRKVTPSKSVPHMTSEAHLKHLAAGLTCATCHNRVAHAAMDSGEIDYDKKDKGPNFIYENFVEMKDGCLRCHNGEKPYTAPNGAIAPTDCTTCHTPDWEDMPIGHVGDWRSQHGAVAKRDFKYCLGSISVKGETGGCHAANAKFNFQGDKPFCAQCHDKKKVSTFVKAADEKI